MRLILVAVVAIALSGCKKAQPPVTAGGKPASHWLEAMQAADPKVRKQAVVKLGNLGPTDPAVYPALVGALADGDAKVRCEAILSLLKLGPSSKEAIPVLTEVQHKDRNPLVRDYATKALERLRRES